VIDGANRLEALKRLRAKYAFVYYVDYKKPEEVNLTNNAHFISSTSADYFNRLKKQGFVFKKISNDHAASMLKSNNFSLLVYINNQEYFAPVKKIARDVEIKILNSFVDVYLGKEEVYRLSELSQAQDRFPVKIIFRKFTTEEIIKIAESGKRLNSGITWHKINNVIVRFSLPLFWLTADESVERIKSRLLSEIETKIIKKDIRYYPSNVYICDEWK
jgi:dihydroorotase